MNGTVIVGYDVSPWSDRTLEVAASEAAARDGNLVVVHAFHRLMPGTRTALTPLGAEQSTREPGEEIAQEGAAKVRSRYPGMPVRTHVSAGAAPHVLAEAGRDAELLVVGNRGRGGFAELLLGSVSHRVLAHAPCPVLVVRGEPRPRLDHVLVLVDVDDPCDDLLEFAFTEAARRTARLTAANVWDGTWLTAVAEPVDIAGETAAIEAEHDSRLANVIRPWQAKFPEVHAVRRIATGSVGTIAVNATDEADLVIIGGGRHGARTGPVADAVLHHASCPVAVVPTGG